MSLQDVIKKALGVFTIFLMLLSVFVVLQIVRGGTAAREYDTITVEASAEVYAAPDIAEITFSVRDENGDLALAQANVEGRMQKALSGLAELGIEEEDIKTTYYAANPRYEYGKAICERFRCDDGERALVGYEVNQSVAVTIRDTANASKALGILGTADVTDLYGPSFRVEDEDALKADAREEAIAKAKEKAKALAKSLGVRIVGIENFQEGYGGVMYYEKAERAVLQDGDMSVGAPAINPTLPQGQNTITSNVTITYRVK